MAVVGKAEIDCLREDKRAIVRVWGKEKEGGREGN